MSQPFVLVAFDLLAKKHSPKPSFVFDPTVQVDSSGGGPSAWMPFLVLFGGVALIVLVVYLGYQAKQKRRADFMRLAVQLNLTYSVADTFGLLGYPFTLFQRGDGRGIENVLQGAWQETDVVAFDYWYYDESTDSKGGTSRTYHRFDCALLPMPADCARLTIERENLLTRMADALSFKDVQFESEEFNRAFNVKTENKKFANDLVDARMMEWLLAHGTDYAFEVLGNRVLVAGPKVSPMELVQLLGVARGFVQHVPQVVPSLYPG